MAHPTTQLRILAPPDPDSPPHKAPSTAASMANPPKLDSAMAAASAPNSSPLSNHIPFSRLQSHGALSSQRPKNSNPPPAILDSHLQAKPFTVSAMLDSSKFHLVKSKSHPRKIASAGTEKLNKLCKELGTQKFFDEKKEAVEGVDGSSGLSLVVKDKELKEFQKGHRLGNLRPTVSLLRRGGRRRSFGGSKVELADIFANNGVRVVSVDMPPVMQIHAVDCARKAHDSMEKFTSKTLALSLKRVISLRNLMGCMVRPGTASLGQVLGLLLPIQSVVSYISQWTKSCIFCYSKLPYKELIEVDVQNTAGKSNKSGTFSLTKEKGKKGLLHPSVITDSRIVSSAPLLTLHLWI